MESLASRTNVASLRAGSAARPASHLNRGRAAPVAVRASGADDDGNNKTSSAVAGACPSPESQKPQTPKRRRASFDASPSPGSRGANAIAASQCHGSPSRPLLSRTAVSRSNPRARCHRITT